MLRFIKFNKKVFKDKSESLFSVSLSLEHPNDSIFLRNNKIQFSQQTNYFKTNYKKVILLMEQFIFLIENSKIQKDYIRKKHSIFEMPKKRSIDLDDYQDYELIKKLNFKY